jgi:hypothetical protein
VWRQGNGSRMGAVVINAWSGLAAGPTTWWAAANGGHDQGSGVQWENKVYKIDLAADVPQWTLVHPGSPRDKVTVDSHYADGLPTSRHSYYSSQFINARNRVMQFGAAAPYAIGMGPGTFGGGPVVDGFNITTGQWDPARTYPDIPLFWIAASVAKHPDSEDVYVAARGKFAKWTQATNSWSMITPKGFSGSQSWEFKPSVIDVVRNRWTHLAGSRLASVDLTTYAASVMPITGPMPPAEDYSPLVHDLDNDRYLTVQGTTVYTIDPVTGMSAVLATVPKHVNGVHNRFAYFPNLGGIAFLPSFASNILFIPTR